MYKNLIIVYFLLIVFVNFELLSGKNFNYRKRKYNKSKRDGRVTTSRITRLIDKLEKADHRMFEHLCDYQLSYDYALDDIKRDREKTDYDLLRTVEIAIETLESIQTKLSSIGDHLRHHKFLDYDWRNITDSTKISNELNPENFVKENKYQNLRYLLYSFPVPKLQNEHYEISDDCKESFEKCIDKLAETFSKNKDVAKLVNGSEHDDILMKLAPFNNHLQRWQYRATASYYMCSYAIKRDPLLRKFGSPCTSHIDSSYDYYLKLATDTNPYECALLSYCPDFCYGEGFFKNNNNNEFQARQKESNPCHGIGSGACEINIQENNNFEDLKINNVNLTCECGDNFKFFSKLGICIDIDECDMNTHDCYGLHETCLNKLNGFECVCKRGFKLKYIETVITVSENFIIKNKTIIERQCIRNNALDDIENDINEKNHKFSKEKIMNLFNILHNNLTTT